MASGRRRQSPELLLTSCCILQKVECLQRLQAKILPNPTIIENPFDFKTNGDLAKL
jgi:hypothetical protein